MHWSHMKTAVIIGAASRIGRDITVEIARQGFKVGIVDYGIDDAQSILEILNHTSGKAEKFSCDVRDPRATRALADHIFNAWGEVGLLVINAGVDDCGRNAGEIPIEEWEEVINTNLWGVVYGCHAFIPNMIGQGGGHIAVGTYGAGIVSAAEMAPYYIAKAAVTSYANKLVTELAPYNIGVSMLCSPMINNSLIDRWLKKIGFDVGIKQLHKV